MQHFFCPCSALLLRRTQLEHRPAILIEAITACPIPAAEHGCSVQIARAVEDQVAVGQISLLGGWKAVENGFRPWATLLLRRRKLVHRAAAYSGAQEYAVPRAAIASCAVQIPGGVDNHAASRSVAVAIALEDMKHSFGPRVALLRRRSKLKDDSTLGWRTLAYAVGRGTVEIACFVRDHAASGIFTVAGAALEAVEHFFLPFGRGERG